MTDAEGSMEPDYKFDPWEDDGSSTPDGELIEATKPAPISENVGTFIPGSKPEFVLKLDEIVEIGSLNSEIDAATSRVRMPSFLEMRQIAGTHAGTALRLPEGDYKFVDAAGDVLFEIEVNDSIAYVNNGAREVTVDDTLVSSPTKINQKTLSTGQNQYVVRAPRSGTGDYSPSLEDQQRSAIAVPKFKRTSKGTWVYQASELEPLEDMDTQSWEFMESVRAARQNDAITQRQLHPDPEELGYRVLSSQFGLGHRGTESPHFLRFSISHGTLPWRPHFDKPDAIARRLHPNIDELCFLPAVPITANLNKGALAIVGDEEARLSSARHAIISILALSEPGSVELKVIATSDNQEERWGWLSALPAWASATDNHERVVVVDGMRSFDLAGLHHAKAESGEMKMILLVDSEDEVPDYCDVVLSLEPDGRSYAKNATGDGVAGTALGISNALARSLAQRLDTIPKNVISEVEL